MAVSILPSESSNSNSGLTSLSSSPGPDIVSPTVVDRVTDQDKNDDGQNQKETFIPTIHYSQSQSGDETVVTLESQDGDETVMTLGSQSSGSIIASPEPRGQSPSRGAFEIYTGTTDIRPDTSLFSTEAMSPAPASSSSISDSRTSSLTPSTASSLSGLSLNIINLGDIAAGARPHWPTLVEDAFSTSSVGSGRGGSGSSTASLAKSSSGSTATTTMSPPRFSTKEKGKAPDYSWRETTNKADESEGAEARQARQASGGETPGKLKSSMKKRRYRRVTSDDRGYTRHRVIQEEGIWLACAGVLVVRPAVSNALRADGVDGFDLFED
ncbi:hypothetical protein CVT25_011702 [Psilocybe cyanescens]|uniref:Uncharacterized protein n=1 Tax=Psilocybe cyanescens TaxID=93625 RepID=A0A409WIN1_PSICY|nr:hypothetical protein CVT25_011702 [Psilocybe cyanescens]